MRRILATAGVLLTVCVSAHAQTEKFHFGAIGDTAYSKRGEIEFDRMVDAMNKEQLAFVVHVGDFEADPRPYARRPDRISMPCVDASFERVLKSFQRSKHPFILTPGDNDWTDCHLLKVQKADPLERLARLRQMFFPEGKSLGQTAIAVTSQTKDPGFSLYRENLTWTRSNVLFATLHIVGSNYNAGRNADMDKEHAGRTAANIAWMKKAFAAARAEKMRGLALITQANVGFETFWADSLKGRYLRGVAGARAPKEPVKTGYDAFVAALTSEMETFRKPVLFVHGDTHVFHISKPLMSQKTKRFFQNFTRVEVLGDPDTNWVRIGVDPESPAVFSMDPVVVPGNVPQ